MTIGLLTVELHIEEANSLKDKRQVLKSLLAHLRSEFNISATEVGDHDVWRTATVGIAVSPPTAPMPRRCSTKCWTILKATRVST